jgi:hypothetical protein
MQPEIRMRRVEHALFELKTAHNQLVDVVTSLVDWKRRQVEDINTDVIALLRVTGERLDRLEGRNPEKEKHGSSEEPDTQRSGGTVDNAKPHVGSTDHFCQGGQLIYVGCQACNPRGAHADASAAEPERSPADSAEPAGDAPGHT